MLQCVRDKAMSKAIAGVAFLLTLMTGCAKQEPSTESSLREMRQLTDEIKAKTDTELKAKGCSIDTGRPADWTIQTCVSKMDGKRSLTANKSGVFIRCSPHKTETFVNVDTQVAPEYGSDRHRVRIKLDGGSPQSQRWSEATSGNALFSPD